MIRKRKTCIYKDCKTRPTYNFEGQSKAIFCNEHKKDNMINVISNTCEHKDCKKQPTYNVKRRTKYENRKKL